MQMETNATARPSLSVKEMVHLSGLAQNEEMITKLCAQAAVSCQNQSLRNMMVQLAQGHLKAADELARQLQTLAGQTGQTGQSTYQ